MKLFSLAIACFLLAVTFALDWEYSPDDEWVDFRLARSSYALLSTTAPGSDPVNCTAGGLTCGDDCQDVYLCVQSGTGFDYYFTETCQAPQSCNNGKCSDTASAACSPGKTEEFQCNSLTGMYPDPVDCQEYHFCVKEAGAVKEIGERCDSGWQYNPRTTYCDKPLANNTCPATFPIPVCGSPGQSEGLKENPSIYYLCLPYPGKPGVVYPFLYRCPNGKIYDNKTFSCK